VLPVWAIQLSLPGTKARFFSFPQSLQMNAGKLSYSRPRPFFSILPLVFHPVYCFVCMHVFWIIRMRLPSHCIWFNSRQYQVKSKYYDAPRYVILAILQSRVLYLFATEYYSQHFVFKRLRYLIFPRGQRPSFALKNFWRWYNLDRFHVYTEFLTDRLFASEVTIGHKLEPKICW
jgi:hypothetical protein